MMEELDVVVLTTARPDLGLIAGQVGTVVHKYSEADFHVEFVNQEGSTYAITDLPASQLMKLRFSGGSLGEAAA